MKITQCKFEYDKWGMYITPLIGYSWNNKQKSLWIGWIFWLFVIDFIEPKDIKINKA